MNRQQGGSRREAGSPREGAEALALHDAVADADRPRVCRLLDAGAPLEAVDAQGRTPLGVAAALGDLALVRELLARGADARAAEPAAHAAGVGPQAARRVAAREGDEVRTPLTCAVESGELEVVEVLLEAGASPYTGGATSALELAVLLGDAEIVRALLDAGADPNARDSEGDTPLAIAAAAGQLEPIEALLQYGAIASARNDDGDSALAVAAAAGRREAVALLAPHFSFFERMRAQRALRRAARAPRAGRAPRPGLLARTDRFHDDALHGRLAAVRKALAMGVAPDERWKSDGDTALALAVRGGHVAVVRALLEAGADPNLAVRGETPIAIAIGPQLLDPRARRELVRVLAAGGGDVDERDADGLTPLMRAVLTARGDARTAETLLELGADLAAQHASGMTALELAQGDPAKAELARALEGWASKSGGMAPRAAGDVASLRGLGDAAASCVVLAVRAPIDAVAQLLERRRGGRQWSRDVYGRDGLAAGEEGILVYRLRGHAFTLAQSPCLDARALRARDALRASQLLATRSALIELGANIGLARLAVFENGEPIESLALRRDGALAFQSRIEPQLAPREGADAIDFLRARLEALELYVPGFDDDRLERLVERFAPRDFERVDFLRLDASDR